MCVTFSRVDLGVCEVSLILISICVFSVVKVSYNEGGREGGGGKISFCFVNTNRVVDQTDL